MNQKFDGEYCYSYEHVPITEQFYVTGEHTHSMVAALPYGDEQISEN